MRRSISLSLAGLAFVSVAAHAVRTAAEDRGTWFKSLRQPITGMSCCDIADCRRTEANWHGGQWWAQVGDKWTPIPPEKLLEKASLDGEAYVCSGPSGMVYCFVPPAMAM